MNEDILNLFRNFENGPSKELVLLGKLPYDLLLELDEFVNCCREIKDHKWSFLRKHRNIGENTYQVSVPRNLIEKSYLFPYINYLGEFYLWKSLGGNIDQYLHQIALREHEGHFDGYDFWINFCNKGSVNNVHSHAGTLSGIIYYQNDIKKTTSFKEFEVNGQRGEILIFPAHLQHWVEQQDEDYERITFSFNLVRTKENDKSF